MSMVSRLRNRLLRTLAGDRFAHLFAMGEEDSGVRDILAERAVEFLILKTGDVSPGMMDEYLHTVSLSASDLIGDFPLVFSQEGEDLLLRRMFPENHSGFFVDVGAHHPIRFSNTWILYLRGWRGINIDATPGSMDLFRRYRPRDVNVECAVSDRTDASCFHLFEEKALNTFDAALAARYVERGWPMLGKIELRPRPLASILAEHMPPGKGIDIMSVDAEGEDLAVLSSNDWNRFRPSVLVIEVLDTPMAELSSHAAVRFLAGKGYEPTSRLLNSVILRGSDRPCAG